MTSLAERMHSGTLQIRVRDHFRLLHIALTGFGELLLYFCFISPAAIDQHLALISLTPPNQAQLFGTVWPYFSVTHLLALIIGGGLFATGSRHSINANKAFVVYCAINVIGIVILPFLTPRTQPVYWDFALEFLRLSSLVLLASTVIEARNYDPAILARSLTGLLAIPAVLVVFTNPFAFLSERGGRLNAPGLEITSTGHVGALAILLAISGVFPKIYRMPLVILGAISLLGSGSRIPFLLVTAILVIQLWKSTKSYSKRILMIFVLGALVAFAIILTSTSSIAGGRLGSLTGGGSDLESEYAIGRGVALLTTIKLVSEHPFGYLDSDWGIQQELANLGFPSHTHSFYFQSYLRFGPLMFIFLGVICWRAIVSVRNGSPYAGCLWFFVVGCALDYYGFVTKAMLIVFVIFLLNERRVALYEAVGVPELQNETRQQ
ncbi:MAG TPA: O-antigen ligase family protein [Terracidiphilus sp.]|nr:O-antigen ligase family protein [Terracidiphilus sp.]